MSVLELFEGVMEVRASARDKFPGGEDFDDVLVAHFLAAPAAAGLPDATDGAPAPCGTACAASASERSLLSTITAVSEA